MALTEVQINSAITHIQAEIDAIVVGDGTGADKLINYRVGDRQFDKTTRLRELRELLAYYQGELAKLSAQEVTLFDDPDI